MQGVSEEEQRTQIFEFLFDFKELMSEARFYVKDHYKNVQALIALGITTRIRDEIIYSLACDDYSSGPNPDQLKPGYYWEFGKDVDTVEIYIKLKIITFDNGDERAVCISFHPSEYPMKFPYRRKK